MILKIFEDSCVIFSIFLHFYHFDEFRKNMSCNVFARKWWICIFDIFKYTVRTFKRKFVLNFQSFI